METLLTVVPGGHVFAGTWEALAELDMAACAACGEYVKLDGELLWERKEGASGADPEGLCGGWGGGAPPDVLRALVRGMTREAPGDKPNGPTEAAIEALHAAHLRMLDVVLPVTPNGTHPALRAAGDRIADLVSTLSDDARALRLAHEAVQRPVERTPEVVLRAMLAAYEAAAESCGLEFYRTATGDMQNGMALIGPWAEAETAVDEVRSLLCWTLSGRKGRVDVRRVIGQDYEARLRGDRPLDAPPLEEPQGAQTTGSRVAAALLYGAMAVTSGEEE